MNHAASVIQDERDALGKLLDIKEEQLRKQHEMLNANNLMLQQQITKINEERQDYNAHVASLNARIRELENGAKC